MPSDLRVLKTSLRSVFKIHKDPHTRSLTYTNKGALIDFRCEAGDLILTEHLKSASTRATYISKTILSGLVENTSEIRSWKK